MWVSSSTWVIGPCGAVFKNDRIVESCRSLFEDIAQLSAHVDERPVTSVDKGCTRSRMCKDKPNSYAVRILLKSIG